MLPQIDPNYEPHATLEQSVTNFLTALNFHVFSRGTYHEAMPPELVETLQHRDTPTALYLRGRADRIAVHRARPIEFEFECKTHANPKLHDMTIEALPLAHHIVKSRIDVKCLYCYRDPYRGLDFGFWTDTAPTVDRIFVPNRWQGIMLQFFDRILQDTFPGVLILHPARPMGGSGDPFIIVKEYNVNQLASWQELIDAIIH